MMKPCQEIIVSDLKISSKEQQLKNRFLSNNKPNPFQPSPAKKSESTLKTSESLHNPQISPKSFPYTSQSIPQISNSLLVKMLGPLDKQIKEVKICYEETKSTSQEIISQIKDLKKSINGSNSVEESAEKSKMKKQAFDVKEKESKDLVSSVLKEGKNSFGLENCIEKVEDLRKQIQAVNKDTEEIELDMRKRLTRVVKEAKTVKSIAGDLRSCQGAEGSEEKIERILGNKVKYDEILWEINEMKSEKNKMMQEFKKMVPVYPKVLKQISEKSNIKIKPAQVVTVSQSKFKKSVKTRPGSLKHIAVQTKISKQNTAELLISRHGFDKDYDRTWEKETSCSDKNMRKNSNIKNDSNPNPKLKSHFKTQSIDESCEKVPESLDNPYKYNYNEFNEMLRIKSPEPFQTRPGICKGQQTNPITFDLIYPNIKNIETQEPPKPSIIEKTVDAVTEYLLNTLLPQEKVKTKLPETKSSKWLGVEELSELTELGLYFDPLLIEKIGKEVLKAKISQIKSKNLQLADTKPEDPDPNPVPDPINSQPSISENHETSLKSSQESPKATLFDKISPKTPPQLYNQRFEIPEIHEKPLNTQDLVLHHSSNLQNLLNPRLLSRMNSSSIQVYISALIDSGHIPNSQMTPSFYSRSPSPQSQSKPASQRKHCPFTTPPEAKFPEEFKDFLSSPLGGQIFAVIKENPLLSPDQVMQTLLNRQDLNPNRPNWPIQPDLIPSPNTKLLSDKQEAPDTDFNLELEERKITEESYSVRKVFNIPVLEIYRRSHSNPNECLVTDSDVSGLSQSGSAFSEIFNVENSEVLEGLKHYINKAKLLGSSQASPSPELSEGEIKVQNESLSSGEISQDLITKRKDLKQSNTVKLLPSGSDLFSQEEFDASLDD